MEGRERAGQQRGVGRQRQRRDRFGLREAQAPGRERVEHGRRGGRVAVAADVVGPQRVDAHQQDRRPAGARPSEPASHFASQASRRRDRPPRPPARHAHAWRYRINGAARSRRDFDAAVDLQTSDFTLRTFNLSIHALTEMIAAFGGVQNARRILTPHLVADTRQAIRRTVKHLNDSGILDVRHPPTARRSPDPCAWSGRSSRTIRRRQSGRRCPSRSPVSSMVLMLV